MFFKFNKLQCEGRDLNPTQKTRRYGQLSRLCLLNKVRDTASATAVTVNRRVLAAKFFAQALRRGC